MKQFKDVIHPIYGEKWWVDWCFGDDDNDGTYSKPLKSVSEAIRRASKDEYIFVKHREV